MSVYVVIAMLWCSFMLVYVVLHLSMLYAFCARDELPEAQNPAYRAAHLTIFKKPMNKGNRSELYYKSDGNSQFSWSYKQGDETFKVQ